MTQLKEKNVRHDGRLLAVIVLLFISASAALFQAWILSIYIDSAIAGKWSYFTETFGVQMPVGPDEFCFGRCAPELPFVAGWVSIATFLLAVTILTYSWWKPKSSDPL